MKINESDAAKTGMRLRAKGTDGRLRFKGIRQRVPVLREATKAQTQERLTSQTVHQSHPFQFPGASV